MGNSQIGPGDHRRDEFAAAAAVRRNQQRLDAVQEESYQLREGTYYSRISEIWGTENASFEAADDASLRRNPDQAQNPPNLNWARLRGLHPKYPYLPTREGTEHVGIQNEDLLAAVDDGRSRTSHKTEVRRKVWPYNIFGGKAGEVAHLMPAAPNDAPTWHMVAEWVLGVRNLQWPDVKLAINGFRAPSESNRRPGTGIKHFTANKMKMSGQGTYMDNNPCVLIVPIRTVEQAKNWNGEGYEAIVAADDWENEEIQDVCMYVGLSRGFGREATPHDIEISRILLSQVVRGMAYRVFERRQNPAELPREIEDFDDPGRAPRSIAFSDEHQGPTVKVPIAQEGTLRVRKVSFNGQTTGPGTETHRGHIAPDPLILAAKAACVWSTRHGERLVAGGEIEDDTFSEGDIIAAEAYLAAEDAFEESLRPRSRQDLARGLHQPNGYQAGVLES